MCGHHVGVGIGAVGFVGQRLELCGSLTARPTDRPIRRWAGLVSTCRRNCTCSWVCFFLFRGRLHPRHAARIDRSADRPRRLHSRVRARLYIYIYSYVLPTRSDRALAPAQSRHGAHRGRAGRSEIYDRLARSVRSGAAYARRSGVRRDGVVPRSHDDSNRGCLCRSRSRIYSPLTRGRASYTYTYTYSTPRTRPIQQPVSKHRARLAAQAQSLTSHRPPPASKQALQQIVGQSGEGTPRVVACAYRVGDGAVDRFSDAVAVAVARRAACTGRDRS